MYRTIKQTQITGRLANRGCQVLEVVHLSTGIWVAYRTRAGKVRHRTYPLKGKVKA